MTGTNTFTLTGAVDGSTNFQKTGGGTLVLAAPSNTFSGTTTVTLGTMTVNGGLSSAVDVKTGAVFNGGVSGSPTTIGGPLTVENGGQFSAGAARMPTAPTATASVRST